MNIAYGFGKHGDDPGTRANLRSPRVTLHPSRDWAYRNPNMKNARPLERIAEEMVRHLERHYPFNTIDGFLQRFLSEMRAVA